ncbi:hypothetical protein TUM20983_27850 [Mycobacterium antarcticum]|nr:hypothetical protein TUM20983_27850 [Mycolicibacterium sp. TUM20983]GLP83978.1 hypothetical protein TUM20984_53980 [Mycolicibacterium sp. TUM20984]
MTEWRDIPGYEGYNQASNMGDVKSLERTCQAIGSDLMTAKTR